MLLRLIEPMASLAAAAFVIVACSPSTNSQPAEPSFHKSNTPAVQGFPDMSNFTEVDFEKNYEIAPPSAAYHFSPGEGMSCFLDGTGMLERAYASCTGLRPDLGPGKWEVSATPSYGATVEQVDPNDPDKMTEGPGKVLPPMHVLRKADDQYCGVDDTGMIACLVGEHGFILTPTETKEF